MKAYREVDLLLQSFLAPVVGANEWVTSHPAPLIPGKETRFPLNRRLGGRQSQAGVLERENHLPVPEFEPRIVQPRPSLCTDYAVEVSLVPLKIQNFEF